MNVLMFLNKLSRITQKKSGVAVIFVCLVCVTVLASCASGSGIDFQVSDKKFGDTETLNYEYSNKGLVDDVREDHYLINTEIDDPVVVRVTFPDIKDIHVDAPITGSAIVQFVTDDEGKIISHRFVKRAGVGLDDYVEKTITGISVKPVVHKGEKRGSVFNVRFIFREKQK